MLFRSADEGERDARVAAGGLDDEGLRPDPALALGRADHGGGDAVLHAAQGVEELEFGEDAGRQPGGDAVVDRIVRTPGGQRALVTLKANSRGKRLRLALKRIAQNEPYLDGPSATDAFFTVADFRFVRAPWEED